MTAQEQGDLCRNHAIKEFIWNKEHCPFCAIESLQAEIVELKAGKPQDWRQSAEYLSLKEAIERVKAEVTAMYGPSALSLGGLEYWRERLEQAIGEQGNG